MTMTTKATNLHAYISNVLINNIVGGIWEIDFKSTAIHSMSHSTLMEQKFFTEEQMIKKWQSIL